MTLSDLIHAVIRVLNPAARNPGSRPKPTMIIPSFSDLRDGSQSEKVRRQCHACARLLSEHLYRWERTFPQKSLVKTWDTGTMSFVGMDIVSR
jgi:hypothetical protein